MSSRAQRGREEEAQEARFEGQAPSRCLPDLVPVHDSAIELLPTGVLGAATAAVVEVRTRVVAWASPKLPSYRTPGTFLFFRWGLRFAGVGVFFIFHGRADVSRGVDASQRLARDTGGCMHILAPRVLLLS